MSLIQYSDVLGSIEDTMSARYGEDVTVVNYNGQILVVSSDSEDESLVRFNQVMHYLSGSPTWFYRTQHSAESVFEETLIDFSIPFKVRESQLIEYVYKPEETMPIEAFVGGDVRNVEAERRNLQECYERVDRYLRRIREPAYQRKISVLGVDQSRLYDYHKISKGNQEQLSLQSFPEIKKRSNKTERVRGVRKIKLDLVFDYPEPQALIFGELKAFPTVARGLIEERTFQLEAYDAWLMVREKGRYTPFFYVLPTLMSHQEAAMAKNVTDNTGRELIPLAVTTTDYVKSDLDWRQKKLGGIESALRAGKEISMRVVETHRKENDYVTEAIGKLGLFQQE